MGGGTKHRPFQSPPLEKNIAEQTCLHNKNPMSAERHPSLSTQTHFGARSPLHRIGLQNVGKLKSSANRELEAELTEPTLNFFVFHTDIRAFM